MKRLLFMLIAGGGDFINSQILRIARKSQNLTRFSQNLVYFVILSETKNLTQNSQNLGADSANFSSLRGARSEASATKQSKPAPLLQDSAICPKIAQSTADSAFQRIKRTSNLDSAKITLPHILLFIILFSRGGGFCLLNAIELSVACEINGGNCDIKKPYDLITNHTHFTLGSGTSINLAENGNEKGIIATFINYNTIDTYITFNKGAIKNLINYGAMQGISVSYNDHSNQMVTIQNFGTINPLEGKYHFKSVNLTLQNYAIKITEDSAKFNAFSGTSNGTNGTIDNSHLVLQNGSVKFAENGKLILDFGENFEFGSGYLFEKLVVDKSGANKLGVDISHLTTKDDIFEISQSGKHFIITPKPQNTLISATFRTNLRTMNNLSLLLNSQIFPRKFGKSQNLTQTPQNSQTPQKRTIRRIKKVSSLRGAESNAQFSSLRESVLADSWQSIINANEYANLNNSSDSWIASVASLPRNDEFMADSAILKQNETFFYKNAESTAQFPSLRESALADSWQSTNTNKYANPNDSSDSWIASVASLPRNDEFRADSALLKQNETFFYKNAESNAKITHPLNPPPQGRGRK
ncbi:hypothetical protein [Helicobacter sp. 23-1045]